MLERGANLGHLQSCSQGDCLHVPSQEAAMATGQLSLPCSPCCTDALPAAEDAWHAAELAAQGSFAVPQAPQQN